LKYRHYLFSGPKEGLEILSAFLFEDGFEGVAELGAQLEAYTRVDNEHALLSDDTRTLIENFNIQHSQKLIEDSNWNAKWESSFEPIHVPGGCMIRASHHPVSPDVKFDILIQPKMSFGTGHHPTTYLMVEEMLQHDFDGLSVFDYGTGTGVLAVLAEKMGAASIFAVDIDENSIDNVAENIALNQCKCISFELGGIERVGTNQYSIVLANITRNTLLDNWRQLYQTIADNGLLMISGFYKEDIQYFEAQAAESGLTLQQKREKDNWLMMTFKK